jgi:uncharacterized protein YndB with AHSA1/START domain
MDMASDTLRTLDHQYYIHAKPSEVFRAITEPGQLTRWLCDHAELTPKKGGRFALGWKDGPTHTGTVLEFVPGERVDLTWTWPGIELEGTVFSLSVEPKDEGTILHIQHTGFPRREEWTDLYGGAEWGWTYFAMNLKSVLENGHDLRSKIDG